MEPENDQENENLSKPPEGDEEVSQEERMKRQRLRLERTLARTRERVDETLRKIRNEPAPADRMVDFVRQNPMLALLGAAGAGIIVGRSISGLLSNGPEASDEESPAHATTTARETSDKPARDLGRKEPDPSKTADQPKSSGVSKDVSDAIKEAVRTAIAAYVTRKANQWVRGTVRRGFKSSKDSNG